MSRRTTFVFCLLLALGSAVDATASWMGNFRLADGNRAYLAHGQFIHIDFDFKVNHPDGARFAVSGIRDGALVAPGLWAGSPVYPDGTEDSHHNTLATRPSRFVLGPMPQPPDAAPR